MRPEPRRVAGTPLSAGACPQVSCRMSPEVSCRFIMSHVGLLIRTMSDVSCRRSHVSCPMSHVPARTVPRSRVGHMTIAARRSALPRPSRPDRITSPASAVPPPLPTATTRAATTGVPPRRHSCHDGAGIAPFPPRAATQIKVSFDIYDFEDSEFLQDLEKVSKYYDNVIVLEHKLNKEKLTKQFETLSDVVQNIKDDNIQFGNLIFYNFDIPAIKRKLKERNL